MKNISFLPLPLLQLAFVLIVALALNDQARGAAVAFTDEASFISGVSPTVLESFETLADTTNSTTPIVTSLFTLTYSVGAGQVRSTPTGGHFATDGVRYAAFNGGGGNTVLLTFSVPQTAFGLSLTDWGDTSGVGNLTFQTNTGELFTPLTVATNPPQLPSGAQFFVGFKQDTPFTQLSLASTTTSDGFGIDGIRSRPVPEPGSATLTILGLFCALARKARRQSNDQKCNG